MIDFLHLPKPQNGTVDYFPGFSSTNGGSWEVWNKPRGANFIKIITIAGGGGGGGGNDTNGGGGGASANYSTVMIPAIHLPDRLYVSSGVGGRGGAGASSGAATSGSSGTNSHVSITSNISPHYLVCTSRPGGGGGATGTVAARSAVGAAPSVEALSSCSLGSLGHFTSIVGQNGVQGGLGSTGEDGFTRSYPITGLLLSGGAGGGSGLGFFGGEITAPASQTSTYTIFPTLPGGFPGSFGPGSLPGGDGLSGINNMELLLFTGGSGGATGDIGLPGGNGGDGGIGCGGGGAGSGSPGGNGGNGGPGLVVISCW